MATDPRRWAAAVFLVMALGAGGAEAQNVVRVDPSGEAGAFATLAEALAAAGDSATVEIAPGTYSLSPTVYREATCGNCEEDSTAVTATGGLQVSGKGLTLRGAGAESAVVQTNAGYGILFEDCASCTLSAVTVTGGVRDTSGHATDGAVVAKRSALVIEDCILRDNVGDSTTVAQVVVGISGIVGRERSFITARRNRIVGNSWDGIAIYRGAQAVIEENYIDGVELARGDRIGGGRGVGIGVTWDAFVSIRGNLVRRYWKGIGAFVDAQVTAEDNIVEHIATWGLTLWDAGHGRPSGNFSRNGVYDTGACGASIVRGSEEQPHPGRFVQNVLVKTGQDPRYDWGEPYCDQVAIAKHAVASAFAIGGNLQYQNRNQADRPDRDDMDAETFFNRLQHVAERWKRYPVLLESDLWQEIVVAGPPDTTAADSTAASGG